MPRLIDEELEDQVSDLSGSPASLSGGGEPADFSDYRNILASPEEELAVAEQKRKMMLMGAVGDNLGSRQSFGKCLDEFWSISNCVLTGDDYRSIIVRNAVKPVVHHHYVYFDTLLFCLERLPAIKNPSQVGLSFGHQCQGIGIAGVDYFKLLEIPTITFHQSLKCRCFKR